MFPEKDSLPWKLIAAVLVLVGVLGGSIYLRYSKAAEITQAALTHYRIMPLGDSITDGFPTTGGCNAGDLTRINMGGYRIELGKKLQASGVSFEYVGQLTNGPTNLVGGRKHSGYCGAWIGGARPAAGGNDIYSKADNLMTTYQPDIVLLQIGTNDIINSVGTQQEMATRLGVLVDKLVALSPSARIVVSTVTPLNKDVSAFNSLVPGIVSARRNAGKLVFFNDNGAAGLTQPNDFYDYVHPNANGYLKMASKWHGSVLTAIGASPTPTPPPSTSGQPDLIVTDVTPVSTTVNQPTTFKATVKNQGTGATPAGTIHGVAFRINGTLVSWNDVHTSSLAAGASVTLTATGGPSSAAWTPTASGTVTVEAEVDDINRITGELNETNNKLAKSVTVGSQTATKTGDVNGDSSVNGLDLSTILTNYGRTGQSRQQGDLNGDGTVNGLDLSQVLANYGR